MERVFFSVLSLNVPIILKCRSYLSHLYRFCKFLSKLMSFHQQYSLFFSALPKPGHEKQENAFFIQINLKMGICLVSCVYSYGCIYNIFFFESLKLRNCEGYEMLWRNLRVAKLHIPCSNAESQIAYRALSLLIKKIKD